MGFMDFFKSDKMPIGLKSLGLAKEIEANYLNSPKICLQRTKLVDKNIDIKNPQKSVLQAPLAPFSEAKNFNESKIVLASAYLKSSNNGSKNSYKLNLL